MILCSLHFGSWISFQNGLCCFKKKSMKITALGELNLYLGFKSFLIARQIANAVLPLPLPSRFIPDTPEWPVSNCLHRWVLNHHSDIVAHRQT